MNDLNNLGSYGSINAVWAKYPEGGKEGDYLTINGTKYRWNKYDRIWENANTVTETPARKVEDFFGDVNVHNDLTVGGVLRAKHVKQPNCGLFDTLEALKKAFPNPDVGMWAAVGKTAPAPIYRCDKEGVWTATGETGGVDDTTLERFNQVIKIAEEANATAAAANETATTAKETADIAKEAADDAAVEAKTAKEDAATAKTAAKGAVATVSQQLKARLFVNASILLGLDTKHTSLPTVVQLLDARDDAAMYKVSGIVLTFKTVETWESWQWLGTTWDDLNNWRKFGGSATVGNCYNVTNDVPLQMGYYDLETAIVKAFEKGYTTIGIQITFAIGTASWKTYQYVGSDSTEVNFKNPNNWLDLAGMTAGDEMFINVDYLCGGCTSAAFYTLEYAISAIIAKQTDNGISYAKSGLVITYKTGDYTWETKQFKGESSDFGEVALWQDFGGGGGSSTVETKDAPEEGGKDAFSTGGAYDALPVDLKIDTETEGVVKLSMVNAKGEGIGNEQQFSVGTGGGAMSGTIVSISPQASPLYAQAGGSVVLNASIRSITMQGAQESLNIIERVELYDRDTNQLLETYRLNQASSADAETFDFAFDLSSYFSLASQRRFRLIAYDDSDNSGSRNINITAVDVTIKSEQTLNYTSSTAVQVGGSIKTLPMYRFPNNASDKGILCTTEIFIDGEWKILGIAIISDTYSHSISVNPQNCADKVLKHGAYPIRIHGEDIASGVVGNYLHTAIMVVEKGNNTPIVATRWYTEQESGQIKQYETISLDFAVYSPAASQIEAEVVETIGETQTVKQTTIVYRPTTYTYLQRVSGVVTDGSAIINLSVRAASVTSQTAPFRVQGTLLDIEPVSAQLMVDIDFAGRSNADADKTISDNGYTLSVEGANYATNGFVKDSFGTDEYGTENDTGVMSLRIAENVTAALDYAPFNQSAIETNGMAVQFRIRTRHIADNDARLISCISNGIGFYVTGKNVVFTTDNAATVAHTITAALKDNSITDVAIVIEPTSQAPYAGIGCAKMYFDGELIGTCYYDRGSLGRHASHITFDGTHGDLYLYNIRAWETYYSFEQSFNNYLLKLSDSDTMIREYHYNQVMASQSAEGKPATNRPQAAALHNIGIPYFVVCKNADTADTPDNYPDYLETLNGDKKTSRIFDIYAYFPDRPWQDFKAIGVPTTNQGTTSSMRPIKNIKMKFKNATINLLHDRSEFSGDDLAKYDECAANAAKHKIQIIETSVPTNIICVKVDYSESGGANNGASTQLYNEMQRALGSRYMTPAQNAYTGKYVLNTSIDSIPIAFFRTDANSSDATSPSYGYFHAKGNWNDDKGDAAVFGFEDVPGYNAKCLNYGDFIELIAARDQTLDAFVETLDKTTWDTSEVYVLSEFCGPNHKVFRHQDGAWTETTGTMTYAGGHWQITGDVVNPVENYELRAYNALDWFQGVKSVDDMLAPDSKGVPIWLTYFESRYPDDDDLNQAYEDGRKVPYQLYKWLEWCEQCNQNLSEGDGDITIDGASAPGSSANRLLKFKRELHKVANVHSAICYHVFTDYIAAVDQRSKNMMVGFYLEPDGSVKMYLNHLYDGDTILGSDNDCGLTIPAELDPNNDPNGYYQGHDSVLFTQLARADYIWLTDYTSDDDTADATKTTTVAAIAATMRSVQLPSGLRPFSPQGLDKYWVTDRLSKWPKLVSSYDGIRKYIEHSVANDNYFYALHGLSIQRLQDFIATRFLYRDGYYRCGDTYSSAMQMRCTGMNMSVTITAAKDGFFGIGVDQANSARESVYLKEGESATLHTGNTNLGSGVMLYIYGADRIGVLDIRNATPKQSGWDISELTLLKRLIIGGEGYSPATNTGEELSTLNLGQLPFLEELDVRNFPITSIDATYCPRLRRLLATNSSLQSFTPAQTSPLDTLALPATMTALSFVNLPNLIYPNGGLTIQNPQSVKRLQLSNCKGIDTQALLSDVILARAAINEISIDEIDMSADVAILDSLKESGAKGIASELDYGCDGLRGTWLLTSYLDEMLLTALQEYFPELVIQNAQYTMLVLDDSEEDAENISNLDNRTGYMFSDGITNRPFEPSGHVSVILAKRHAVMGKYQGNKTMLVCRLDDTNRTKYYDGSDANLKGDRSLTMKDEGDVYMYEPDYWYKGIDDYLNGLKYHAYSSLGFDTEPQDTRRKSEKIPLSLLERFDSYGLNTSTLSEGAKVESNLAIYDAYNVFRIDVADAKMIRWPSLASGTYGAAFADGNGNCLKVVQLRSCPGYTNGDYLFAKVPRNAVSLYFTTPADLDTNLFADYCVKCFANDVIAVEPDWVKHENNLCGIYQANYENDVMRSISGVKGTNSLSVSTYIVRAAARGEGFQAIDYEMSKDVANLFYAKYGTRDSQKQCGYGSGTTASIAGLTDILGMTDTINPDNVASGGFYYKDKLLTRLSAVNVMGYENWQGDSAEWMSRVGLGNGATVTDSLGENRKTKMAVWQIKMYNDTTREVQGVNTSDSGIARVRNGRYMDVIPTHLGGSTSTYYCDWHYFSAAQSRVVLRSNSYAGATGGVACANASYDSSYANASCGSRLAFRGTIRFAESVEEYKAAIMKS